MRVSPFSDPTFSDPGLADLSDPTYSDPTLKRVVSLVIILVVDGNMFYTTEASANHL